MNVLDQRISKFAPLHRKHLQTLDLLNGELTSHASRCSFVSAMNFLEIDLSARLASVISNSSELPSTARQIVLEPSGIARLLLS